VLGLAKLAATTGLIIPTKLAATNQSDFRESHVLPGTLLSKNDDLIQLAAQLPWKNNDNQNSMPWDPFHGCPNKRIGYPWKPGTRSNGHPWKPVRRRNLCCNGHPWKHVRLGFDVGPVSTGTRCASLGTRGNLCPTGTRGNRFHYLGTRGNVFRTFS